MVGEQNILRRAMMIGVAAVIGLSATACTTNTAKPDEVIKSATTQPVQHIDLDPMLIQASPEDADGKTLNADEVFQRAYRAYSSRKYEEAIEHYATIIKYFPDSRFFLPSLFNGGLANEKLERWDAAAAHYRTIIEKFPTKKDAKDAYYRLAQVHAELGDHATIVELMTQVMLRPDIEHFDRIEAHVRRANAHLELGHPKQATEGYFTLLRLNKEANPNQQLADNSHYISQAHFGLGRAYHMQVMEIPLVLPTEKMGEDLQAKAELFLKAQSAYIRALRVHHPQWSVASGYMIGRLYEDFYLDILQAEIPDKLTEEQLVLYFEELRKQLRPLMVRAIQVYEKNLSLSRRIDTTADQNEWAQASDTHLQRLKAYLDDPFTQRRAERLVIQGRPLEQLWDPHMMATDVISEAVEEANRELKQEAAKDNI